MCGPFSLARRKPPVPLHHPTGGPPPPAGEDRVYPLPVVSGRRSGPFPPAQPSRRIVEDQPQRVPPPGPDFAHPVAHRHAIVAAAPAHRPRVHRSEEHTSELQSLMHISYAVFCLTTKK